MGRGVSVVFELIEGVRGEVGDFSESAVLRLVRANSSSLSEGAWSRGERRREGREDTLDASLISVGAIVEMSVSASESVPDEDRSLAEEVADDGRIGICSGTAMLGNEGGIMGEEDDGLEGTMGRGVAGMTSSRFTR
jgi:hypothetical protein